jgi:transcriptional regulator with XRE-family HTH domain
MSSTVRAHGEIRPPIAHLLRTWRTTRKISQLELSMTAGVSQRQLSFIESGRARPTRDTVLHLAEALEVPLRERNTLLQAAGFSALYPNSRLDDPTLSAVREALDLLLTRHEPNPAVLVDRQSNLLAANRCVGRIFGQFMDLDLMLRNSCGSGSPNLLRLTFHPDGLRPYILNWMEVAPIMLMRAHRDAAYESNEALLQLLDEIMALPGVAEACQSSQQRTSSSPALTLDLGHGNERLRLFTMISNFGWPQDLLTDEVRIESFLPADADTAKRLNDLAGD